MEEIRFDSDGWLRLYVDGKRLFDLAYANFSEDLITDPPIGCLYEYLLKIVDGANQIITNPQGGETK